MKNKQDELTLLDSLSQVDESLTQKAYDVDSAEKFHALGKARVIAKKKEKPADPWRSWGAMAACLALILLMAASPWIIPSLLPPIHSATQPSQPATTEPVPTTTEPIITEPIVKSEIRLTRLMDITHRSEIKLQCSYFANQAVYHSGDVVSIVVMVENLGGSIPYVGDATDQLGTASLVLEGSEQSFTIMAEEMPYTDDATTREFAHLEQTQRSYWFEIPQDAPEGNYVLEVDLFGQHIRFDSEAALAPNYVPCLAELPEEAQKIIAGSDYGTDRYKRISRQVPVYGEFGNVYVVFYPGYGSAWETSETVNGLTFRYGSSVKIKVISPERVYSMTEAFELGILTAEQVQQVYDNYQLVGTTLPDNTPYIKAHGNYQVTLWDGQRLHLSNRFEDPYKLYYAGDQLNVYITITNYDLKTSVSSITDSISMTAWLISVKTGHKIESASGSIQISQDLDTELLPGESIKLLYTFTVPEDIQKDDGYRIMIRVGNQDILFDSNKDILQASNTITPQKNMMILGALGEDRQQMIYAQHTDISEPQGHMVVYYKFSTTREDGVLDWVCIYLYPNGSAEESPTVETVAGMEFEYPPGYTMYVFSMEGGLFTVAEAFDAGIIGTRILGELYNNYLFLQDDPLP